VKKIIIIRFKKLFQFQAAFLGLDVLSTHTASQAKGALSEANKSYTSFSYIKKAYKTSVLESLVQILSFILPD